jgi:hypothetical protein
MPTNDIPPDDDEVPDIVKRIGNQTRQVAGASERLPLRVIVLFAVTAGCLGTAITPLNFIGLVGIILLALDTAQHRR